jgi:hypothetical protein
MKKITLREKIIMVVAFVFIAIVLFENLFVNPLRTEMKELANDIALKEEIIAGLAARQTGYESITEDLERSRDEYIKTVGLFPSQWDDSEMLNFIEETIGDGFVKKSLTFNGLEKKGNYAIGSFSVTVNGSLDDFNELLFKFENAKYYCTIPEVRVADYDFEKEAVDETFILNFYVLTE